jgi:hypothetical protein
MAEVTRALIFEGLKRLQSDMAVLEDACRQNVAIVKEIETELIAQSQDIQNIYAILSRHDGRLARIERRLEITEPA